MSEIKWQEPYCAGGGNACLQIGHTIDGTPILRETSRPEDLLVTTREGLRSLVEAAKRGELDHLL
ncbi:DUF397 domain-containing protein [Streptomyces albireticuli]|uniref:DUF397 domain-containing protein n=1 Tax=Streptomyces albireticuli TaxID=1940 RepID=A0A2A2D7X4_9ACTN|nr:DUF397 domain-containing protein [Streptomyces albireticuli]MCD9145946.1 DUF397 domain-containing protein [Streptomyces albireticuli]MCD9166112.1 DUF397 domain-containing protein [Streptomyces albireticuli]MCD9196437.1 DUF397 domain-containing protein [Streptomyces albireticuli]PAU47601.1 hypothetical protein CK936_17820 [Streptomyces albireticuli]